MTINNQSSVKAICGTAFYASSPECVEILEQVLICVNEAGTITDVVQPSDERYSSLKQHYKNAGQLTELKSGQYLLPGFVDLHVHAPQWPQNGKALHLPLYEWLQDNTFPLEARYSDVDFARQVYRSLVDTLLANGTTTTMYFATIHHEASLELAKICLEKGQRALVGKVAMDDPQQCPDFYRDVNAQESIESTRNFIESIRQLSDTKESIVYPVVTPRFIPSCTDELLFGTAELAQRYDCHIQTHCSESDWAHQYVKTRFNKNDAQALNDFGLLTRKTILAHANFLSDDDMATLAQTGAGVAHCTLSNFYFANSVFPLKHAMSKGLNIGLGTDISGGHSPSMFDSCRYAIAASCALEYGVNPSLPAERRGRPDSKITFVQAFWLATAGGGQALDLPVGQFKPGFAFDAIVVDIDRDDSNISIWPELDSLDDVLQKIIYNAGRSNVVQTWVQGRKVHQK